MPSAWKEKSVAKMPTPTNFGLPGSNPSFSENATPEVMATNTSSLLCRIFLSREQLQLLPFLVFRLVSGHVFSDSYPPDQWRLL